MSNKPTQRVPEFKPGSPEPDDFSMALQENFTHARHQEDLRERYSNLYWIAWGAAIAFIYTQSNPNNQNELFPQLEKYPLVFLFLAMVSLAALIATLKLNAEFANHITAAEAIARTRGLNSRLKASKKPSRPVHLLELVSPLPYKEFTGFMAFPLKVPIVMNVNVVLALLECLGFALATGLFFCGSYQRSLSTAEGQSTFGWATIIAFVFAFLICISVYLLMRWNLNRRLPTLRD